MSDFKTECPDCRGAVQFDVEDVARERTVRCSRGHSVKLQDEGGGARKFEKSMRDLDREISKLSRTIKFKV